MLIHSGFLVVLSCGALLDPYRPFGNCAFTTLTSCPKTKHKPRIAYEFVAVFLTHQQLSPCSAVLNWTSIHCRVQVLSCLSSSEFVLRKRWNCTFTHIYIYIYICIYIHKCILGSWASYDFAPEGGQGWKLLDY